jgi:hypothetical protein
MRLGLGHEIRRCLFTNYCEGLDQAHRPVSCQLWDRLDAGAEEADIPRTTDGRRYLAPSWHPPAEAEPSV